MPSAPGVWGEPLASLVTIMCGIHGTIGRCLGLLLLCVWLVCPAHAQTSPGEGAQGDAEPTVAQRLDDLEARFEHLQDIVEDPVAAQGPRRDALLYRQDQRALELLKSFVTLGEDITRLTDGSEELGELAARLAVYDEQLDRGFTRRLENLESRIDTQLAALSDLTGIDRLGAEAQVESLNDQRLRYIEYMIDIVRLRQKLSFPPGGLEASAQRSLRGYSEELVGIIELHAANRAALVQQKTSSLADADIKSAVLSEEHAIERAAIMLQRAVDELERLGVDTSRQRRVLLKQAHAVTVSLVDAGLLSTLVEEISANLQRWFKNQAVDVLFQVILFLVIMLLARLLARFARAAASRAMAAESARVSRLLGDVLVSAIGGFVLTIGFLVALSQVGVSVAPMLAGLGVAGFIIGFALQETLGNFAAGAMILAYQPFDTGDYVSVAGVDGFVKKMNLVSTTITTMDNQTLIIPNSKIWGDVIRNFTGQKTRRVDTLFSISYGDSIELAEEVLHKVVSGIPAVLPSPEPVIRVHRHNDSSIDFVVRPWVRTEDYWETYWALHREVKLAFDAAGITIPFPQRDVHHFYPETKAADLAKASS